MPGPLQVRTHRLESPLGRFAYHEWRPTALAGLVELFWHGEGVATLPRKRIFPNGRLELLVNLGPPIRLAEGAGAAVFRRSWISGLQTGPTVIDMPPYTNVLGVRLRPAGAYAVLACPLQELSDLTVDLADVVGRAAEELAERCHAARTVDERFRCAGQWVRDRIVRATPIDPAVAWTAAAIERSAGAAPIATLRDRTGWSKARLTGAFGEQIGVPPKRFARVVRFREVVGRLHGSDAPLAQVALDLGYYDQPHMTAEFRALSGLTPTAFRAAARYGQTIAVAEGR